ncbi:tyrosine aminotransferase [Sinorhizobium mexicanum]|uniref:Aspartate/tyrosine/aromatic aminotransferase n=1 Tax=Sinorhizobium mexicanum TaxID=375549 RepID=A0A859QM39_9HYPH|nr:tyrosine aminotransferase [Sinorhizobium mexicanum]MBP1887123.1 aromatic-amino-acid transaminase [Sinorhizobium mexicanum]QLL60279.1 aspartate/tyrosine/aromatic aminotransferase [Sinorhizobium mexicanum]
MFDALARQPDDPLLALIGLYRKDERPGKVDLGVGVYRDETGHTPIFRAVKAAEKRLLETQDTKAYVGPEGDHVFLDHLWTLVGGDTVERSRIASVQTPGGSGALRLAADLIHRVGGRRIWLGLPSWPNHAAIFKAAGLETASYDFFDIPSQAVLFDNVVSALEGAAAGDAVLLHASCHNPTGGALTEAQWLEIAALVAERGLLPLVDLAYQGFGRGLNEDVAGLRHLIGVVPEALVAVSCSKSFGLYRERTGAIYALTASPTSADTVRSNLAGLARTSYSMPPDHGAAVVRTILADKELARDWAEELEAMRLRMTGIRRALAEGLRTRWQALGAIAGQEGMFSMLPFSEAEVLRLRSEHGIYMPTSGRINIAGLKTAEVAGVVGNFTGL